MKVILDANIFLNIYIQRKTNLAFERMIILSHDNRRISCHLTYSILHIISYFMVKQIKTEKTKERLKDIINSFKLISENSKIINSGLDSSFEDIEDSFLYYTAIFYGMNVLITEDKHLLSKSSSLLEVLTPKEFCHKYPKFVENESL